MAAAMRPSRNPEAAVRHARSCPVHECLINPSWRDSGLARILLARRQPDGLIAFGVYLVDVLCLGLKSTFCNANFTSARYQQSLRKRCYQDEAPVECPVPLAHAIVYGGIDYAADLGFTPDRDFRLSQYILEPRDALGEVPDVEFGRDGKPCYVSGPYDDVAAILAKLDRRLGEGNYLFLVGGPLD